jgi:hypothetical protein
MLKLRNQLLLPLLTLREQRKADGSNFALRLTPMMRSLRLRAASMSSSRNTASYRPSSCAPSRPIDSMRPCAWSRATTARLRAVAVHRAAVRAIVLHPHRRAGLRAELESRHDLLGARNWIEKSLIVAPDCRAAQRQQALLLAH